MQTETFIRLNLSGFRIPFISIIYEQVTPKAGAKVCNFFKKQMFFA
jgi:hypothetical protein